jgi:hypothetical protein
MNLHNKLRGIRISCAILILTLLILLITACTSSAQEHVAGYGEICFPCHNTLLSEDEKVAKLAHCRCHSVDIWRGDRVDMSKLSKLHGDAPCIKCHAGPSYSTESMDVLNIHTPHSNVQCAACHGEGSIVIPETESCLECHKGGVHEIHQDVLIDVCVACHGKVIHKFAELRAEVGITEEVTPVEEKKTVFSLYDLIKSIIAFFTGGF